MKRKAQHVSRYNLSDHKILNNILKELLKRGFY